MIGHYIKVKPRLASRDSFASVLSNSSKFRKNRRKRSVTKHLYNKVTGLHPATLLKKPLRCWYFAVSFLRNYSVIFLYDTCKRVWERVCEHLFELLRTQWLKVNYLIVIALQPRDSWTLSKRAIKFFYIKRIKKEKLMKKMVMFPAFFINPFFII